jgi:hypothetical protein
LPGAAAREQLRLVIAAPALAGGVQRTGDDVVNCWILATGRGYKQVAKGLSETALPTVLESEKSEPDRAVGDRCFAKAVHR